MEIKHKLLKNSTNYKN